MSLQQDLDLQHQSCAKVCWSYGKRAIWCQEHNALVCCLRRYRRCSSWISPLAVKDTDRNIVTRPRCRNSHSFQGLAGPAQRPVAACDVETDVNRSYESYLYDLMWHGTIFKNILNDSPRGNNQSTIHEWVPEFMRHTCSMRMSNKMCQVAFPHLGNPIWRLAWRSSVGTESLSLSFIHFPEKCWVLSIFPWQVASPGTRSSTSNLADLTSMPSLSVWNQIVSLH